MLIALLAALYAGIGFDAFVTLRLLGTTRADILGEHLTWGISIGQYVSYVPILVAIFLLLPWTAARSLRALGLGGIDGKTLFAGAAGAIAMYAVTIGAANLEFAFTHAKPQEAAVSLFSSNHDVALGISFGVLAALVAPFVEELIFRGFLFNAILRYTPFWVAAVVSGLVFGMSHGSPTAFFPLACSGVVLAYVYYRTGSLTASMVTHGLFNTVNVLLIASGKVAG